MQYNIPIVDLFKMEYFRSPFIAHIANSRLIIFCCTLDNIDSNLLIKRHVQTTINATYFVSNRPMHDISNAVDVNNCTYIGYFGLYRPIIIINYLSYTKTERDGKFHQMGEAICKEAAINHSV